MEVILYTQLYIELFIRNVVYWISCCPQADKIFAKVAHTT